MEQSAFHCVRPPNPQNHHRLNNPRSAQNGLLLWQVRYDHHRLLSLGSFQSEN